MARNNARKKPNKKPNRKGGGGGGKSNLERRARRDVQIANQPAQNALDRMIEQLNIDFQNQSQGVASTYEGLRDEQRDIRPVFREMNQEVVPDLMDQTERLSRILNQEGLPTEELSANTALFGQYGNNALNNIGSARMRNNMYNESAGREGMLSERYAQQNLSQGLSDQLQGIYNRQTSLKDQMGPQILQRMDELKDDRGDRAYDQMMADLIGNQLGGGGGGGGNRRGNNRGPSTPPPDRGASPAPGPNVDANPGPNVGSPNGYAPGNNPNTNLGASIRDWREGDARWRELGQGQRRRIRRKGIEKFPPPAPPAGSPTWNPNLGTGLY